MCIVYHICHDKYRAELHFFIVSSLSHSCVCSCVCVQLLQPLNAWTSLIYTVCGVMIFCCGVNDSSVPAGHESNNLVRAYMLSIFYGLSCMYLGVASFLFHASHAETWRYSLLEYE